VDRASLQISGFPWAHRGRIGRIGAYFKTVWLVTIGSGTLRYEASRRQDARDARRFARITAALLATAILGALVIAIIAGGGVTPGGLPAFAVQAPPRWQSRQMYPGWAQDLIVPWCAGAVLVPVLPVGLTLLAFAVTALPRAVFRGGASEDERRSAAAIASYVTAPLVFFVPAAACLIGAWVLDIRAIQSQTVGQSRPLVGLLGMGFVVFVLFAGFITVLRITQWLIRTRRCGFGGALLGLGEVLGLWALAAIFFAGVLPWCVGYGWILIGSFR
jgi:hypothetical protein